MRLQDSLLSRCPLSQANTTLRPSDKAPMITSNAARSFAIPAFTYKPSAHWYTTSRPDRAVLQGFELASENGLSSDT